MSTTASELITKNVATGISRYLVLIDCGLTPREQYFSQSQLAISTRLHVQPPLLKKSLF